ncbi:Glycosyl transferases group 1 [Stieleria neptunia]|uniref:Glycosyl transferases group 1 n=1 Tax=Stieleria neptunia TaxID=2527979 RepID=A0A518HJF9_9BACT|nr:glycosyltransferase family 1 protein [Stieleria neptunia]QDV40963.1 Glycosyl transferases group 1 [Stieleria neptunia]
MRIAFWLLQDSIRQWAGWVAGLHYVRNCLEGLACLPEGQAPQVVAFVPESLRDRLLADAGFRDAPWLEVKWIEDELLSDRSRRRELQDRVAAESCDMLFPAISPPGVSTGGKTIGWITDLQHKHYPQFFSEAELNYRDDLFSFLIGSSSRIVCSSQSVRDDLEQHFPAVDDRGFILRFRTRPPASALQTSPKSVLSELGIDRPYAYLPYQFWQHKNHRVVFEAWALLLKQGLRYPLICSGATVDARAPEHFATLEQFIRANGLADQIKILGMVPREQQWQLYRGARLILQPSLFEGWSTSVEESRSLGKSVFLSDIAVHREQMDGIGTFFDPADATDLAEQLKSKWDDLPDGFDEAIESSSLVANQNDMQQFGRQLVELFRETHADTRVPIAPSVLPLLLSIQNESEQRLDVIHQLSAEIDRLRDVKQEVKLGWFDKLLGRGTVG